MKLIYLPLALLLFTALFNYGFSMSGNSGVSGDAISGSQNLTGSVDDLEVEGYSVNIGFGAENEIMTFVIAMVIVGAVAGITVLGSGIKEISVKIIYTSVAFFGLWLLISLFSVPSLEAIPVFGWALYFVLTLVYGLGVFQQINGV